MSRSTRGLLFLASAALLLSADHTLAGGKEIFLSKGCNTCHSVPTERIKKHLPDEMAPDLVNLAERYTEEELVDLLHQELRIGGKEVHKRQFKGSDDILAEMVQWLLVQTDDRFKGAKQGETP